MKIQINFLDDHKLIVELYQNLSCNLNLFRIAIQYLHYKSYNNPQIAKKNNIYIFFIKIKKKHPIHHITWFQRHR